MNTTSPLDQLVAFYMNRAPKYGYLAYECSACGLDAAADNADDIRALIEDAAYGHISPADVIGVKMPEVFMTSARIGHYLAKGLPAATRERLGL